MLQPWGRRWGDDTPSSPRLTFEGAGAGHAVLPAAGAGLHQEAAPHRLSRPLVGCPPGCHPPLAPGPVPWLVPCGHHLQRLGEQAALQLLRPCPGGDRHLRPAPPPAGLSPSPFIRLKPPSPVPLLPEPVSPPAAPRTPPPGHGLGDKGEAGGGGHPPMSLRNSAAASVRAGVSCRHSGGGSMPRLGVPAAGPPGKGGSMSPPNRSTPPGVHMYNPAWGAQ